MKRSLFALLLALSAAGLSAKAFEGTVTYKTLGSSSVREMTFSIRNGKVRVDMQGSGAMGAMLLDSGFMTMTLLMPEKKSYMKMKLEKPKAAAPKDPLSKLRKTGKRDTIAGFFAEEWAYEGEEQETTFWGTRSLGGWSFLQPQGPGGGISLPEELRDGGFLLLRVRDKEGRGLEAVSVQAKKLADALFEVPWGYKETKSMNLSSESVEKVRQAMKKDLSPEQREALQRMLEAQKAPAPQKPQKAEP